jgi:hypothetical protein
MTVLRDVRFIGPATVIPKIGERTMRNRRGILIAAWAVAALLAGVTFGQEGETEIKLATAYSPARPRPVTSPDRHVRVWRVADATAGTIAGQNAGSALEIPAWTEEDAAQAAIPQGLTNGALSQPVSQRSHETEASPFADEANAPVEYSDAFPGSDGCCNGCGGGCAYCGDCCCGFGAHRSGAFGEMLFLRASGVDMAYAMQMAPGLGGAVPDGRVGVVDPVFSTGFRVGYNAALGDRSSVAFTYTNFFSHASDTLAAPDNGGAVSSLVLHPNSSSAGTVSSLVTAGYDIDFQFADVMYRHLAWAGPQHAVNFNLGLRYGNLRQTFQQTGDFDVSSRTNTAIKFEGVGLRTGLDGERRLGNTRLSFYGNSFISVLFGQVRTSYTQLDTTNDLVQATSSWDDRRVVPILEYELGVRWTSYNGRWRASTGYYTAFWFNTITTSQYVQAVQTSDFVHLGQTTTFDGFVSRLEYCY